MGVIHWELGKKFKLDHTSKWYIHKPESVLENKIHIILWDLGMEMNHLISARRPDLVIVNKKKKKKNIPISGLSWPGAQMSENQRKLNER